MKKIDFHIHTISTISDAPFEFDLDKLKEYVLTQSIDCIAVTNHNKFDIGQYNTIKDYLPITVFPGIEINLENGHLLLVSDDNELDDFNSKCNQIEELIQNSTDSIDISTFNRIFPNLNRYILVPHYDKKPNLHQNTIEALSEHIKAGEVSSVKKFKYCMQDSDSLTPVIFSDCRLTTGTSTFPIKQTYIDLDEISFMGVKSCLYDKSKIALSKEDGNSFFQVANGIILSTGLNVILGERSSGKTYTLDKIYEQNEDVKYIKQFSLLQNDEESFNRKIKTERDKTSEGYLKEFRSVIEDIENINIDENGRQIEKYLDSLFKYASETEMADIYSKCALYNEDQFLVKNSTNIQGLIEATQKLLENEEYTDIIEQHLEKQHLKALLIALIERLYQEEEKHLKTKWLNSLIGGIKRDLQTRSSQTRVDDLNLYQIALDGKKIEKFIEVVNLLKIEKEIYSKEIGKFKVVGRCTNYIGAQSLKNKSGKQWTFSTAYSKYNKPYEYLQELKKVSDEMPLSDYYKYFVDIEYEILNNFSFEVSGGERAEFYLLNEIEDALKHNILLIDEPESSFDNLFLKGEVNKLIKDLSTKIPVVIVTHNNTVGASIKPDYILYTKREIVGTDIEYKLYSGYPSDKILKDSDGNEIENYHVVMSCLEAGNDAYNERRSDVYEILKD